MFDPFMVGCDSSRLVVFGLQRQSKAPLNRVRQKTRDSTHSIRIRDHEMTYFLCVSGRTLSEARYELKTHHDSSPLVFSSPTKQQRNKLEVVDRQELFRSWWYLKHTSWHFPSLCKKTSGQDQDTLTIDTIQDIVERFKAWSSVVLFAPRRWFCLHLLSPRRGMPRLPFVRALSAELCLASSQEWRQRLQKHPWKKKNW